MQKSINAMVAKNGVEYDGICFCNTEDSANDKVTWCEKLQVHAFAEDDSKNIEELKESAG